MQRSPLKLTADQQVAFWKLGNLQNPLADVTLLGTRTEAELRQSLQLLGTTPDPDLLAAVEAILEPIANLTWPSGRAEHFEPGALTFDMNL